MGEQMKLLKCPACSHAAGKANFAKTLQCPNCSTRLRSNIVSVTNWEGVLATLLVWIPFSVITRTVGEEGYVKWIILIALLLVMHFMVLTTFVQLEPSAD